YAVFRGTEKTTAGSYLRSLCLEKLPESVPHLNEVYQKGLEKELTIIHNRGFDDNFLIVWDVMYLCHNNQIVTGAGRGSA
ncbi:DNA polymerase III subunit alpha, partial [Enterococcus faecalis]